MGKPKEDKESLGRKLINESKNKVNQNNINNQKETTKMEKYKTLITVVITIVSIALLGVAFCHGVQYGISHEQSVNGRVVTEAKSLVTLAEPKK